jgi:hypothetical protein
MMDEIPHDFFFVTLLAMLVLAWLLTLDPDA